METTTAKIDLHEAAERARRIEQEAGIAVEAARKKHQQAGIPMAGWRDGRVVVVDPVTLEELPQPDSKKSS